MKTRGMIAMLAFGMTCSFAAAQARFTTFNRLGTSEIRKILIGSEFTDEADLIERYRQDGTVKVISKGKTYIKHWRTQMSQLCLREAKGETCYEVWRAGTTVQMRRTTGDDSPKSGILRKYTP